MDDYSWIKPGKRYKKKPQWIGHRTRKSVEVTWIGESIGIINIVHVDYLTGRGSGRVMSAKLFAELYENPKA